MKKKASWRAWVAARPSRAAAAQMHVSVQVDDSLSSAYESCSCACSMSDAPMRHHAAVFFQVCKHGEPVELGASSTSC